MARRRIGPFAYRALARIEKKAEDRAEQIARDIVAAIYINAPRRKQKWERANDKGPKLHESFYVKADPVKGGFIVASRRRYWAFVEFGTQEHGDAQPFLRPAIDAVKRYYE